MARFAVQADRFVLPGMVCDGGYLVVEEGRFVGHVSERPACEVVDRSGSWVAPGLVDTHVHGFLGHDVTDCDWDGVAAMAEGFLANGVTSWLATTMTASTETIERACGTVGSHGAGTGARIQGLFLEGPFFAEKYKGAQDGSYFCDPDVDKFDRWQKAANGMIRKIGVAPERDGSVAFTSEVTASGVKVALGHSDATYEQASAAVAAGASVFIHTYNAMSPLHHRNPGMVGCAMTSEGTYAELICDGHHVNPVAARALVLAKGWDRVALITDCMRAGGMPEGDYDIGGLPVIVADGTARLKDGGNLAGSVLNLDQAVRNVVDWGVASAEQALRMASEIPAKANGIDGVCGSIQPGRNADFIVLSPSLELRETYLGGKTVYEA